MHTKDLFCDDGCDREAIEGIDEGLPDLDIASPFAFVVESIDSRDIRTLVVATKNEKILGVLQFIAEQQQYRLQTLFASINVVAEKEEIRRWWEATHLEQSYEIVVLAMNVSHDFDGGRQLEERWLRK